LAQVTAPRKQGLGPGFWPVTIGLTVLNVIISWYIVVTPIFDTYLHVPEAAAPAGDIDALFTYLRDSAAQTHVVLGDARLSMARETPSSAAPYDVIVLDAFSGDAIPVHLLTAEAIALYRRHLRPGGLLVFNISSQYLDLAPQLALQARHAGMKALLVHSTDNEARGLFAADWVILSANESLANLPAIVNEAQPIGEIPGLRLWTDDYSSLLPLLRWKSGFTRSGKQ